MIPTQDYWKRWRSEYLLSLRERAEIKNSGTRVSVGEVVLIEDITPRSTWKLGVIEKVFPGCDNLVRSVNVRTNNGVICRPITRLYPLELSVSEKDETSIECTNKTKRLAAQRALEYIKYCV